MKTKFQCIVFLQLQEEGPEKYGKLWNKSVPFSPNFQGLLYAMEKH